jgi:hypothetical protein
MRTLISQRRLLEKVTDALALIGFAGSRRNLPGHDV